MQAEKWVHLPRTGLNPDHTTRRDRKARLRAFVSLPAPTDGRITHRWAERQGLELVAGAELARRLLDLWTPGPATEDHLLICLIFRIDYSAMIHEINPNDMDARRALHDAVWITMRQVTHRVVRWSFVGNQPSDLLRLTDHLPGTVYRALGRVAPGDDADEVIAVLGRADPDGAHVIATRPTSQTSEVVFDPQEYEPLSEAAVNIVRWFVARLARPGPYAVDVAQWPVLALIRMMAWYPADSTNLLDNIDAVLVVQEVMRLNWIEPAISETGALTIVVNENLAPLPQLPRPSFTDTANRR